VIVFKFRVLRVTGDSYDSGGYGGGSRGFSGSKIDDIDDFGGRNRRMNPAEQAIDKVANTVKDLFNKRRNYETSGPHYEG